MAVNNRILDRKKLVDAEVKRVILHWTAGHADANSDDLQHYHLVVPRSGRVVWGYHSIADNDRTDDGKYAAHVRGLNTGSIGVALAGMAGSTEHPFQPGSSPITHAQYEIGCRVIAELCDRYGLAVTPRTVLNHAEVEQIYGVEQRWKWDVMVLPWNKSLTYEQVGEHFRNRVGYYYDQLQALKDRQYQGIRKRSTVIAPSGLNLRAKPTVNSDVLDVVPHDTEIEVYELRDGWARTNYNNRSGWLFCAYLSNNSTDAVG